MREAQQTAHTPGCYQGYRLLGLRLFDIVRQENGDHTADNADQGENHGQYNAGSPAGGLLENGNHGQADKNQPSNNTNNPFCYRGHILLLKHLMMPLKAAPFYAFQVPADLSKTSRAN
jgi:hypothetical protein